jgi:DNA-binding NarL/FixJ family response regulator
VNNQSGREQIHHIILVEAHVLVRQALRRVLIAIPQMHITASLGTIQDVLLSAETTGCTIVLGPSVSVTDSLRLVKQLRERQIRCGFVVIQQSLHPETIRALIEQGVHSLLDESTSEQELTHAIRAASLGNIFLSQRTCSMLTVAMTRVAGCLTEREIQVLSRLKYGESNFRIAYTLGLKEKTIEKYLTSIYDKLNVHSRAEAILCLQKLHF